MSVCGYVTVLPPPVLDVVLKYPVSTNTWLGRTVQTEFVTVGRVTIADSEVHGSLLPSDGPIGFGAALGDGDGKGAPCANAPCDALSTAASKPMVNPRGRITSLLPLAHRAHD
jgi:hypothetical protein